jgi:hypothetical protein
VPFYFKGDKYIPNLQEEEEKGEKFEEQYLPILGNCKVFPSLKRISYWEENIYSEDYNEPATAHPEKLRMSFEAYLNLLIKEKEKIKQAERFIESLL